MYSGQIHSTRMSKIRPRYKASVHNVMFIVHIQMIEYLERLPTSASMEYLERLPTSASIEYLERLMMSASIEYLERLPEPEGLSSLKAYYL